MSVRPDWDINDWKSRCSELAFKVAELEAENAKLLEALEKIAGDHQGTEHNAFYACQDIAKAALNEGK